MPDIEEYLEGFKENVVTIRADHIVGLPNGGTATVATLSSGLSADYYTDGVADDVQIQAAIDVISASGGGSLYIKIGAYDITTTVTIPSNTIILGDGFKTQFKANASMSGITNMFSNSDTTNGNTNIFIYNCSFDGNQQNRSGKVTGSDTGGANIYFKYVTFSMVKNITSFNGAATSCITFGPGTTDCTIADSVFYDCWNHVILLVGQRSPVAYCQRNIIRGNVVYGAGTGGTQGVGIELANYACFNTIVENVSRDNKEGGVHCYYYSNNNTVSANILTDNKFGVALVDQADYNNISNNIIDGCIQSGVLSTIDSLTYGSKFSNISNNTITDCGWNGIRGNATADFTDSIMEGNTIDNCGILGSGNAQNGIYLKEPIKTAIRNNSITNSIAAGMRLDSPSYVSITGNSVNLNAIRGIYLEKTTTQISNCIISNNIVDNNTGNGILVAQDSKGMLIANNKCTNQLGVNSGIDVEGMTYSQITGNSCIANGRFGIRIVDDASSNPSSYNVITGNICTGNSSGGIGESGGADYNIYTSNNLLGNSVNNFIYTGVNDQIANNITT